MSTESPDDGEGGWYSSRIGEPATDDEVRGYWLYSLGVILGLIGLGLFPVSAPGGTVRQWSIVLSSAGLVLLVAGPIIRLPLRNLATRLVYVGVVICAAAIVWFIVAFPADWNPSTVGNPAIIGLYGLGLLVMAGGGVFTPILTSTTEAELAGVTAERDRLAEEEAELREGLAYTESDEADLAAELERLRSSRARFELYEDRGGQHRWRLRHRNGNVIADGGEGYTRRHNAQNGIESVKRNALGASIRLIESEAALAGAGEEFTPAEEVRSRAEFELYEDEAGEYRWRLRHDNGNIIADGGEGYASRRNARDAIDRIREYVGPADYLRADPTAFEVYRDEAGQWRWRLVHRNGNVLADGGEGYASRSNARRAVGTVQERVGSGEFEIYEDDAGEFRSRLESGSDVIADSGEGYADRDGAQEAIERLREYAPEADVLEIGRAVFEVYEDRGGQYRWRLRHRNGNILADGGEGYDGRGDAHDAIESVKRNAPNADTEE